MIATWDTSAHAIDGGEQLTGLAGAPATGRFVQRDPIGIEGGLNVYLYCGANPLIGVDPSGLTAIGDDVDHFIGGYTHGRAKKIEDFKGDVLRGVLRAIPVGIEVGVGAGDPRGRGGIGAAIGGHIDHGLYLKFSCYISLSRSAELGGSLQFGGGKWVDGGIKGKLGGSDLQVGKDGKITATPGVNIGPGKIGVILAN